MEELLYVAINSGGSSTYNNALFAAAEYGDAHPDSPDAHLHRGQPYLLDGSRPLCSTGRRKSWPRGAEVADVVDYLKARFAQVEIVLSVHSLKIIKRSGRISAAAAFAR